MHELATPHDATGLEIEPLDDPSRADALVARRVDELELPGYPVDAQDVHVTLHEDADGTPRVAFVMNPTPKTVLATVGLGRARALVDLLPRARAAPRIEAQPGGFVVEVPSRTARLFTIET
jgi:beta-galactosidase